MTLRELLESLAEFKNQDREVKVASPKSDPLSYKERFSEPQVLLSPEGVVLILAKPRKR